MRTRAVSCRIVSASTVFLLNQQVLECALDLYPVELGLPQLSFCSIDRCLECALELYPVELYLPQLARSLDTVKAAKGRRALLEVFTGNCGQAVTTAAALPALR